MFSARIFFARNLKQQPKSDYRPSFADNESTRLQDYKTTSGYRLGLSYCFADYETTSLQDYKWLPPWGQLLLRRLRDYKATSGCRLGLSYCFADYETTSLQVAAALASLSLRRQRVYETTRLRVATAPLVVSLTSCLVVWRSQGLVVLA